MSELLRDYQKDAVRHALEALYRVDRAQVIMASGTGKTRTQIEIWKRYHPFRTLVLVPTIALLNQTEAVWRAYASKKTRLVRVCGVEAGGLRDRDEIIAVLGCGGVCLATYSSTDVLDKVTFDLAIFDEAHRAAAITLKRHSPLFARALNDDHVRCRKRLFFTATRKDYEIPKGAQGSPMTASEAFGDVCYNYPLADAIEQKYASDFRIVLALVTSDEVEQELAKNKSVTHQRDSGSLRNVAAYIALAKAIREYKLAKVFVYTNRILDAENFVGRREGAISFQSIFGERVWSTAVHAGRTWKQNAEALAAFESAPAPSMAVSPRCLIEGVNMPDADAIMFLSRKHSEIDLAQSLGRVLRPRPGKTAYVVMPIYWRKKRRYRGWSRISRPDVEFLERLRSLRGTLTVKANAPRATAKSANLSDIEVLGLPSGVGVDELWRAIQLEDQLSVQELCDAIAAFAKAHGTVPTRKSGDASGYCRHKTTWDELLRRLAYFGGYRKHLQLLGLAELHRDGELSEERIVLAMKKYGYKHGELPMATSGDATEYFGFQCTWQQIQKSLRSGSRGLRTCSSLATLKETIYEEIVGKRPLVERPALPEVQTSGVGTSGIPTHVIAIPVTGLLKDVPEYSSAVDYSVEPKKIARLAGHYMGLTKITVTSDYADADGRKCDKVAVITIVEGGLDKTPAVSPTQMLQLLWHIMTMFATRAEHKVGFLASVYCVGSGAKQMHFTIDGRSSLTLPERGVSVKQERQASSSTDTHYAIPGGLQRRKLREEDVVAAIIMYRDEHGDTPTPTSGDATKYFGYPITWHQIAQSLYACTRGWKEKTSLYRLQVKHNLADAKRMMLVRTAERARGKLGDDDGT